MYKIDSDHLPTDIYAEDRSNIEEGVCTACGEELNERVDKPESGFSVYSCEHCLTDFYIFLPSYIGKQYICGDCGKMNMIIVTEKEKVECVYCNSKNIILI